MDMRDRELDAWISSALQPVKPVSAQSKIRAWEHISRHAARQRILAPIEVEHERASFFQRFFSTSRLFYNWAVTVATEEAQYERARQSYYMMRYGGPSREGRLVFQLVNPITFTMMSPSF